MPSDRVQLALHALERRASTFRSTVIASLERVRGILSDGGVERVRRELGTFAAARIDTARFAELARGHALDTKARTRIMRSLAVLQEIADTSADAFVVEVPEWRRPAQAIGARLARFGRAFGATAAADLARTGRYDPAQHDRLTEQWGFEGWTRAERRVAPPIVATVSGSDLRIAELAELLDGAQHVALAVVGGGCPPAALARLITPHTLVVQTDDTRGVDRFAAYDGPAVLAFVDSSAATFMHDPARGAEPWQRLEIWRPAAGEPRKSIHGSSPRQQWEDWLQLAALAVRPSLPATPLETLAPVGAGDPADRLAEWLLAESHVEGP
jgi:hypothetical protein